MTKAYVLIDPLTGRPIEDRSPTIQESRSEQQFFDEQSQSFDGQGTYIIIFQKFKKIISERLKYCEI